MILFTTFVLNVYIALLSFQINGIFSSDLVRIIIFLFMAAECAVLVLLQIKSKFRQKHSLIKIPCVIAAAIVFIAYFLCYLPAVSISVSRFTEFIFFPFCLLVTYTNFIRIKDEETFDRIIDFQFYYLIVVAAAFLIAQVLYKGEFRTNINTVYYTVFSLPFILLHKNSTKKWIGLVIILLCLFLSLKRTPMIAVVLALIFYSNAREPFLKTLLKIGALVLLIFAADALCGHYFDVHMLDRLLALGEDGGSGRIELLRQTIEHLEASTFLEFLFGHSLVSTASVFARGAHNDFLEILYRMGLNGFLILLAYYVGIFAIISRCNKTDDYKTSSALKATVIMFAVISFFSQLIFLPTYVGLVAMSISFCLTRNRFYCAQTCAS